MREILFRGKTYDGEWVYGGYFKDRDYHFIPRGIGAAFVEVEQGTVGQFTGLLDKKGNKVFEGDILEFENLLEWGSLEKRIFREVKSILDVVEDFSNEISTKWVVIGNIHDNKELENE